MGIPKTQTGYGIVLGNKNLVRFDDLPVKQPGPGEVLLKIECTGLCRSDFHLLIAPNAMVPEKMVMGHEICGSIAQVGAGVENDERFPVGARFSVVIAVACGTCLACRRGQDSQCTESKFNGYGITQDGGFQQYLLVKNLRSLVPIPDGIPYEVAASATDAILTPFHAIMKVKGELGPNTKVMSIGAGGLGLNALQILKTFGCHITCIDPKEDNGPLAKKFGATEFHTSINTVQDDFESFDFIFDFVGKQETIDIAGDFIKSGGKVLIVGLGKSKLTIPNFDFARREVELIFNFGGTSGDQMEILDWISLGKIKPVVQSRPMTDLPEYMNKMQKGEIVGRVVFKPVAKL